MNWFLAGLIFLVLTVAGAQANFGVNQLNGFGAYQPAAGGADIAINVTAGSSAQASSSSTLSQSSASLGALSTGDNRRYTAVCVAYEDFDGGHDVSSVTVDGVTATQLVDSGTINGTSRVYLYIAENNSNTTGTITVTFNQTIDESGMSWMRVEGDADFTGAAHATDTDTSTSSPSSLTSSLNIPTDGALVSCDTSSQNRTTTWSGSTGITENADDTLSTSASHSSAYISESSGHTPGTATTTWNSAPTRAGLVSASFDPDA